MRVNRPQSQGRTNRHPFDLRSPFLRVKPEFDNRGIDRETNPERDAKELLRRKMGQRTGGEEYAHHRAGGCDTEKDCNCAR
jgi:hypothetical protein